MNHPSIQPTNVQAAILILDIFIGSWDIWKRTEKPVFFRKSNLSRLFLIFLTNQQANVNKIFREDRICRAEQKTSQMQADKFKG